VSVRDENQENNSDIICYNCQGKGHIARYCRKPKKRLGKPGLIKERNGGSNYPGKRVSTTGKQQPTDGPIYTIGYVGQANLAFLKLKVDISKEDELLFLIDTGADNSLLNPLNPELNPICYLLALLGAHHFLHVSRIRVKLLTFRRLMSYTYGAPILDVSRSHTTTQHSR